MLEAWTVDASAPTNTAMLQVTPKTCVTGTCSEGKVLLCFSESEQLTRRACHDLESDLAPA